MRSVSFLRRWNVPSEVWVAPNERFEPVRLLKRPANPLGRVTPFLDLAADLGIPIPEGLDGRSMVLALAAARMKRASPWSPTWR
jgi:hypothetical protein